MKEYLIRRSKEATGRDKSWDEAIWKQRNTELVHGTDGAISMEQRRKETATKAGVAVYQDTIGNVSQTDSVVLHHARIDEILKWTKEHLDAYLASADM
jgi:hypothetical protein